MKVSVEFHNSSLQFLTIANYFRSTTDKYLRRTTDDFFIIFHHNPTLNIYVSGEQLVLETIRQIMAARALHNIFKMTESHLLVSSDGLRLVN